MDNFEGFKTPVEEITAGVVEMTRETITELDVELYDGTKLLHFHDKTLMDEKLLLSDKQRKGFLELEASW